jgi:membrane protein implicated in regulation of membrane protease activity
MEYVKRSKGGFTLAPLILWVIISVVALVVDIATSAFVFLWFTVGGIAAIVVLTLGFSVPIQITTFIAVSAISMALGYPLMKKTLKSTVTKTSTMEEGYIGRKLTVDEDFVETAKVKIDGIYWTIKNVGEPVKKGDEVKITGIEGNKLIIKKENFQNVKEENK